MAVGQDEEMEEPHDSEDEPEVTKVRVIRSPLKIFL